MRNPLSWRPPPLGGTRLGRALLTSCENAAGAQRRPVRTAPARSAGAHALKARGIGLAWGEGAPIPAALRADAHCTCCGSTQAFPERSRMMMSGPPLPTLALGRSAKRALHRASRAARSARRLRRPHHQEATRAVIGGGTTCRRPGAQRPRVRRRARSARRRKGCRRRPGAQRPRPRRRARSARRRWQPAAAPLRTQARSALGAQRPRRAAPCAERRARSARRRSGSPQAPGAQRPRHRRRARSARRRQLWHAGAASTRCDAGRLLPASAALTTNIVVWPQTMSPAPGRRPPICPCVVSAD